jgi:flagellar basal body-associated protein FliL
LFQIRKILFGNLIVCALLIATMGEVSAKKATASPTEGAPKASETGGSGGQKVYVSIGPIILPIITNEGPQQIVTMIVSLQVANTDASDRVRQQFPRLVDAYMRALYGKLDQTTLRNGSIIDIDYVKRKVSAATKEIMRDNTVEDVLIQAVAQRQV